jgi:hypothetical protein
MSSRWLVVAICVAGCGDDTLPLPFQDAGSTDGAVDAATDALPPCEAPAGTGTMRNSSITVPETWTAADSPHIIMFDTSVNAAVTIEECAVVQIAGRRFVTIRAGGSITANGTDGRPVRIERHDPATAWSSISTVNGGTLSLAYTIVDGGGDPGNATLALSGALDIANSAPVTAPIFHVDHVEVLNSASQGVYMHDGGGFTPTSKSLIVRGALGFPVHMWPRAVGTLPVGRYSENLFPRILLSTAGNAQVRETTTMHMRGVPYQVGLQPNFPLTVASGTSAMPATLTIEPGVRIEFLQGSTLSVEPTSGVMASSGNLMAIGTIDAPIVFTSAAATPAAGDWFGVWFGQRPNSRMDFVRVEFAGKTPSGTQLDSCLPMGQVGPNDAAIRVLGLPMSAGSFITNTTIVSSARHGIDRAWQDLAPADFTATNTFTDVPGCHQTLNEGMAGTCPGVVTCP